MKKRTYLIGGIGVLVLLLLVSLAVGSALTSRRAPGTMVMKGMGLANPATMTSSYYEGADDYAMEEMAVAMDEAARIMPSPEPFPGETAGQTAADVDQKIIKTGDLGMVVDDVNSTLSRITELAGEKEGFVQHASVYERGDGTYRGNTTIRVPSSRFEETLNDIKALANVVETESISGQDVTEQYTDLEARLRNAEAQEATYLEILTRAETVEDILQVQRELGSIRATIESYKGRIQYLENMTSLSTIHISLSEEPNISLPTKDFRPLSSIQEAGQALVSIAQSLVIGLIWVVIVGGGILIPLGLALILIAWLARRAWRAVRAKSTRR